MKKNSLVRRDLLLDFLSYIFFGFWIAFGFGVTGSAVYSLITKIISYPVMLGFCVLGVFFYGWITTFRRLVEAEGE